VLSPPCIIKYLAGFDRYADKVRHLGSAATCAVSRNWLYFLNSVILFIAKLKIYASPFAILVEPSLQLRKYVFDCNFALCNEATTLVKFTVTFPFAKTLCGDDYAKMVVFCQFLA